MAYDFLGWAAGHADKLFAGALGGVVGAGLKESFQYFWGWYRAGRHESGDFHIAATMYPRINPKDPGHKRYWPALEDGKTHAQELIWLGSEVALESFLSNKYVLRQANIAMGNATNAGLLLGTMPRTRRTPAAEETQRVSQLDPRQRYRADFQGPCRHRRRRPHPWHLTTDTRALPRITRHRRVLRAMFIADAQLTHGLPPKDPGLLCRSHPCLSL